jgi:RNA polymerase sigma-70 factor (ECF subfamily)
MHQPQALDTRCPSAEWFAKCPPASSGLTRLAVASGDEAAWRREQITTLFRRYAPRVRRWASRLIVPGVDPDDVVQDVFCSAYHRITHFEGRAHVSTWLFAITRNIAAERSRSLSRRRRAGATLTPAGAAAWSPVEDLEGRDVGVRLMRLLSELPENFRAVLLFAHVQGMSGREIAAQLGEREVTVRVWHHRARVLLRKLFVTPTKCALPRGVRPANP